MVKTNSRIAKQHLAEYIAQTRDYIVDNRYECAYDFDLNHYSELCKCIWNIFLSEKRYEFTQGFTSLFDVFEDWAQGLALNIFDYYYHCTAVDTLAKILEETNEERAKYTESQAEKLLTRLIFREIRNNL